MKHRLVLFDLDGTLLNTLDDLGAAVNDALKRRNLPLHTREEYMKMVGHGVRNLVIRALPAHLQEDAALVDDTLMDFKTYYTAHIDVYTQPYPGMQKVVETLHRNGVFLAVASNKFQARPGNRGRSAEEVRCQQTGSRPRGRLSHRHEDRCQRRH